MKRYKIAVCLSGQSRTWAECVTSLKEFFNDADHDYYFFGHTWDTNSWKDHCMADPEIEYLNRDILWRDMQNAVGFKKLVVDPTFEPTITMDDKQFPHNSRSAFEDDALNTKPISWVSLFKSLMMANHLKTSYEIENDMKFDLVVRTRFDMVYRPGVRFASLVPNNLEHQLTNFLYCTPMQFRDEMFLPAINDLFYFGQSDVMDLVDSFYRVYHNGNFWKMIGTDFHDSGYKQAGPNVLLWKWLTCKNIITQPVNTHLSIIVRRGLGTGNWPADYLRYFEAYTNKAYHQK